MPICNSCGKEKAEDRIQLAIQVTCEFDIQPAENARSRLERIGMRGMHTKDF